MAVQHVRLQLLAPARMNLRPDQDVGRLRLAMDREAMDAERKARSDLGERGFGAFAAGQAVGDDADLVAAIDLAVGEVEDVAEDAADRARGPRAGCGAAGRMLGPSSMCALIGERTSGRTQAAPVAPRRTSWDKGSSACASHGNEPVVEF